MADKEEKRWKRILQEQKKEMEEITESFKSFFEEHQDVTTDELKNFVKSQMKQAESSTIKEQLGKRLSAIEKMKGSDELRGEELKEELNKLSQRFHDNLNVLDETVTKGSQLMSSGFSQLSGVFRESFGPLFDLWDSGVGILTGIYSTVVGAFSFIKAIPAILTAMKTWITSWLKRKEKREMREGGGPGLLAQILKGIGILGLGIVGAFTLFAEMAVKDFLKAYRFIGRALKTTFISPVVKFLSKFKFGEKILNVFSRIGQWISNFGKWGSSLSKHFSKIGRGLSWLANAGSNISTYLTTAVKQSTGIMKWVSRFSSILTKIGGIAGRIFMPVMVVYEVLKGLFSEGTIRDKILSASAGVMSIFTQIPEWIANGILKLFGFDFRFDFGKEAIMNAVNVATKWVEKPIHAMLDFFTKTVPDVFTSFKDSIMGLIEKAKDIPGYLAKKVKGFFSFLPGVGNDEASKKLAETRSRSSVNFSKGGYRQGGIVKTDGFAKVHAAEVIVPQDLSEKLQKIMNSNKLDKSTAINNYEMEKIKLYKKMISSIEGLKVMYREQTEAIKNSGKNEQQVALPTNRSEEPPDEIESISLLIFNKNWGIA